MRVFVNGHFTEVDPSTIDSICWNKTSATIQTVDGQMFNLSYYNSGNRDLLEAWTPNWQELSGYKPKSISWHLLKQ